MERPLHDFLETDCHEPPRAVVLGKGPSLDDYDPVRDRCGAFVLAINEAAEVVPCDAAIYVDSFKLDVPEFTIIFRSKGATQTPDRMNYVFTRVKAAGPKPGQEAIAIPALGVGTATAAVTILGMWGIKQILLVGCDSADLPHKETGKYAGILSGRLRPHSAQAYRGINRGMINAMAFYGIAALWFHRGERFDAKVPVETV